MLKPRLFIATCVVIVAIVLAVVGVLYFRAPSINGKTAMLPPPLDKTVPTSDRVKDESAIGSKVLEPKGIGNKEVSNTVGMKFRWISPGQFLMGSSAEEKKRSNNETQHSVHLTKGFFIGTFVVTRDEWQAVMGRGSTMKIIDRNKAKNLPMTRISWYDCQRFIAKLQEKEGKQYRLPTEAEWEFACRAGTTTPFFWGETISTEQANFKGHLSNTFGKVGVYRGKVTSVDFFRPNAWGMHDMHGNVQQWCQDWYGGYAAGDVVDPMGPEMGSRRVLRGGSWDSDPKDCRSASRRSADPNFESDQVGCRLVLAEEASVE
jgi:sulfatase modifying factor 1